MKLSVITPVYNGEKYIRETIESVLETCAGFNFEYLIVNDGSTDGTSQILLDYEEQVFVLNKNNSGQADAINEAIQRATGDLGIIVNADDPLVTPLLFKMALSTFEVAKEKEVIVCYPDWSVISEYGKIVRRVKTKDYSQNELIGNLNCLPGPGAIFKLEYAKKINGWDRKYKFVADYDFWIRLSVFGEFQRIPDNLAVWRSHENSISISQKNLNMALERIKVIEEFPYKNNIESKLMRKAKASSFYEAAVLSYFDLSIPGRKWFLKSLSIDPTIILRKSPIRSIYLLLHPYSWKLVEIFRLARAK